METPERTPEDTGLWDEHRAAEFLSMSVQFLRKDRMRARRIPFIKISTRCLYDPADVRAYAASCKVRAKAET